MCAIFAGMRVAGVVHEGWDFLAHKIVQGVIGYQWFMWF